MERIEMLEKYDEIRKDKNLLNSINNVILEIKRNIETTDQTINELIYSSEYYKNHSINCEDSDLDSDLIENNNQDAFDTVYNFISDELKKENIEATYHENKDIYLFQQNEVE